MCGIAGFYAPRPLSRDSLETITRQMTDTLTHRGPDDTGIWVDGDHGLGLGHRRLSIMDLSPLGHQPMHTSDGRYTIVFNGEIYNFQTLRALLAPKGYRFRSASDTEVLLAAVAEWGLLEALRRFVGMFAFALWDHQERALHLVRDRLGIKPLYYGQVGTDFAFASELKALRAHPDFRSAVDRNVLTLYLRYGYVPAPYSIHPRIHKLEPGKLLTLRCGRQPEGGLPRPEIVTWWSAEQVWKEGASSPWRGRPIDAVDALDAQLRDAVRLRMIADVPLGAFLSGGIDSSAVVALMQTQSTRPVKTFTIGFEDQAFNEAEHAKAVANHLGTEHTELCVQPQQLLEIVPRIPTYWDEPFGDSSQIPTAIVCALTRRHVHVSLSGDGGDELFAGYPRYDLARRWRRLRLLPDRLKGMAAGMSQGRGRQLLEAMGSNGAKMLWRLETFAMDDFREFYRYFMSHHNHPASLVIGGSELATWLSAGPPADELGDPIRQMTFWDLITYLPDDILTKVDRASMAVGLEARVPLLDHRVVEFAARLPSSLKRRHGQSKWVLRQLLYRYVPERLVERPKMGFAVPLKDWLRHELKDWAEALLHKDTLRRQGYLEPRAVRRMWKACRLGRGGDTYLLWNILMFQAWLETSHQPYA